MGTKARKARKRAGVKHSKPAKRPTSRWGEPRGLGLTSGAEVLAGIVIRGVA